MVKRLLQFGLLLLLSCAAAAQVLNFPTSAIGSGAMAANALLGAEMDFNIFTVNTQNPDGSLVQSPSASVSKLDLKAPGKAQREYEKGFQLLMKKELPGAVEHLGSAIQIYPS